MIYKDALSSKDTNVFPGDRKGEKCLNCNDTYWNHEAWACPGKRISNGSFSDQSEGTRYLTQSMKNSITSHGSKCFKVGDKVRFVSGRKVPAQLGSGEGTVVVG